MFLFTDLTSVILDGLILWSNLNYRDILAICFFKSFGLHQSHTLVGCHAAGSKSLSIFFTCLILFEFILPTHMSNMISSSCITTIKMIMIKINTFKGYTINDVSLLKNVTKSESKLPKTKQLSENTALSVFTIVLLKKLIRNKS